MAAPLKNLSFQVTDHGQLSRFFVGWDGRFEQLSAGRLAGSLHVVQGSQLRVVATEFNQKLLVRGHAGPGLCSFYFVHQGNADGLWHERRLSPGQIVMHGPNATTDHRTARTCVQFGLTISAERLKNAVRNLSGGALCGIPDSWTVFEPEPRAFATALGYVRRCLKSTALDSMTSGSADSDRLEQQCVRWIFRGAFEAGRPYEAPLSFPSRAALVRKAEELMRSQLGNPLGAVDLCARLGVSDRTLRLAFRERFGLGPMAYYQTIRLNAVRAALESAQETRRIADVANGCGFRHLGNFAAAYYRLFRERPSQTNERLDCRKPAAGDLSGQDESVG